MLRGKKPGASCRSSHSFFVYNLDEWPEFSISIAGPGKQIGTKISLPEMLVLLLLL